MGVFFVVIALGLGILIPSHASGNSNQFLDKAVMVVCGEYSGAGFYIDKLHVMTAKHVIKDCKDAKVFNNSNQSTNATVMYRDSKEDIAILLTNKTISNPVRFDDSMLKIGQRVFIVGSPIDGLVLSQGTLVNSDGFSSRKRIYLEIPADHGNSGGPVFSENGLIGMVTAKSETQVIAYNLNTLRGADNLYKKSSGESNNQPVQNNPNYQLPLFQLSIIINFVMFLALIILMVKLKRNRRIEITLD